jgi:hypothetical protein
MKLINTQQMAEIVGKDLIREKQFSRELFQIIRYSCFHDSG